MGLRRPQHQLPSQAVSETAAGESSPSQPEMEHQHHSQASPRGGVSPGCMTNLHQPSQEVSPSCVTGMSQHSHDMSPSCVTNCVTQPGQEEEQPASSHAASQTHKARQSPTITGAVARLVGHPILNIIVQKLTPYNPGMTEQQIPPACQDDHSVMVNRPIKPNLSVPGAGADGQ